MAFSVQMPALGESVTEGTVTRWLKQEGDTVELDEPLVEVSTDKVDTEIPSPAAGVLTKIIAQEDDTVEVGGELAVIGDAKDAGEAAAPAPEKVPAAQPESKPAPEPPPVQPTSGAPAGGDAKPVLMPELGESVTEGTVIRWLKKIGDSVQVDEPTPRMPARPRPRHPRKSLRPNPSPSRHPNHHRSNRRPERLLVAMPSRC